MLLLWARSYWRLDNIHCVGPVSYGTSTFHRRFYDLESTGGAIWFSVDDEVSRASSEKCDRSIEFLSAPISGRSPDPESIWNHLGFYCFADVAGLSGYVYVLVIRCPYWFVCALAGVVPSWWFIRKRRDRRRQRLGLCPTCAYTYSA